MEILKKSFILVGVLAISLSFYNSSSGSNSVDTSNKIASVIDDINSVCEDAKNLYNEYNQKSENIAFLEYYLNINNSAGDQKNYLNLIQNTYNTYGLTKTMMPNNNPLINLNSSDLQIREKSVNSIQNIVNTIKSFSQKDSSQDVDTQFKNLNSDVKTLSSDIENIKALNPNKTNIGNGVEIFGYISDLANFLLNKQIANVENTATKKYMIKSEDEINNDLNVIATDINLLYTTNAQDKGYQSLKDRMVNINKVIGNNDQLKLIHDQYVACLKADDILKFNNDNKKFTNDINGLDKSIGNDKEILIIKYTYDIEKDTIESKIKSAKNCIQKNKLKNIPEVTTFNTDLSAFNDDLKENNKMVKNFKEKNYNESDLKNLDVLLANDQEYKDLIDSYTDLIRLATVLNTDIDNVLKHSNSKSAI